ncbi:hypothetical protein ACN38_g7035 [Penicillium nordicum]|uniref:Uncharacterized protein n=1 Tax=Penicillium nordicum TaxID=229535 RepID=A0A0M8NYY4_9EURO|nr:hypothetical protein ACN38_g7035 [Penicillium nordicum]
MMGWISGFDTFSQGEKKKKKKKKRSVNTLNPSEPVTIDPHQSDTLDICYSQAKRSDVPFVDLGSRKEGRCR